MDDVACLLCATTVALVDDDAQFFDSLDVSVSMQRPELTPAIRSKKGWRGRRELARRCSATRIRCIARTGTDRHSREAHRSAPQPPAKDLQARLEQRLSDLRGELASVEAQAEENGQRVLVLQSEWQALCDKTWEDTDVVPESESVHEEGLVGERKMGEVDAVDESVGATRA